VGDGDPPSILGGETLSLDFNEASEVDEQLAGFLGLFSRPKKLALATF
jgi:hypothetical protein